MGKAELKAVAAGVVKLVAPAVVAEAIVDLYVFAEVAKASWCVRWARTATFAQRFKKKQHCQICKGL